MFTLKKGGYLSMFNFKKNIKNAIRQAIHVVETAITDDIAAFAIDYDDKKLLAEAERMYTN